MEEITETKNPIIETDSVQLAERIKETDSIEEYLPLFNASIAKKQALRVLKREDIIDKVQDRIKERLEKRPDEMTITELTAIDKTMSEQKQKELSIVNEVKDNPTIVAQQTNVTVNVNGLSRESNEKVLDAVKNILKMANATDTPIEDVIEAEVDNSNNNVV